jgi:hypothetical protein
MLCELHYARHASVFSTDGDVWRKTARASRAVRLRSGSWPGLRRACRSIGRRSALNRLFVGFSDDRGLKGSII